jgi:CheY-specific phosphatase CheX
MPVFAQITQEAVVNASRQFWEQMLSMHVEALYPSGLGNLATGHVQGSVSLTGVWQGRIEVRMGIGLAYEATAAMMMQAVDSVVEADALDATKEIANMIAGVVKSSLPRPCSMTVPESGIAAEGFETGGAGKDCLDVCFQHASGAFLVRVWEQECTV